MTFVKVANSFTKSLIYKDVTFCATFCNLFATLFFTAKLLFSLNVTKFATLQPEKTLVWKFVFLGGHTDRLHLRFFGILSAQIIKRFYSMKMLFPALLLSLCCSFVQAGEPIDLQSCVSVSDDTDRLACFDKLAAVAVEEEEAEKPDIDRDAVVKYFNSDEEPTVKDSTWTQPMIYKVGVLDKGSNRDGFAENICGVLSADFGAEGVMVHVIDIEKLMKDDKWVKLGEKRCAE